MSAITYIGLLLLSVATLIFEINLTRIFSVAQFYHFAFMVVSLALLGFGASGTYLTLFPYSKERDPHRALSLLSWGFALTTIGSYLLTLYVPFDSFRIARDWRQGAVLALHYVALAAPFFYSGATAGLLLATRPKSANRIYAFNMIGSALGCALAVVAPTYVGSEGTVLLSTAMGLLAALTFQSDAGSDLAPDTSRFTLHAVAQKLSRCIPPLSVVADSGNVGGASSRRQSRSGEPSHNRRGTFAPLPLHASRIALSILIALLLLGAFYTPSFLHIRLSPYKSLSQALLYPDADLVFQRWNGFSRVDVVRSSVLRGLPGSGFRCSSQPPPQLGLTVDGEDLSYITHVPPDFTDLPFTDCLLTAFPYRLRSKARVLVLEPRGGFDALVALAEGAEKVTAVEDNPLIVEAVREQGAWAGDLYDDPRVEVVVERGRTYARRTREKYDIVSLSLNVPQHTVTSGAYSLNEDYRYTIQAFKDYVARLDEGGLLVVPRWLQTPPSESVRAFALAVEAVERTGGDPETSIVALRSYRQMLLLVRRGPFTASELAAIRTFASSRAFDLVYLPDIRPAEVNRHNILPEPTYHQACTALLETEDRGAWYEDYPFDVRPPTDDWPFFGHFFKWEQAADVLAMAGHTWQPFGGAGYFVLLILLALAVVAAGLLILFPLRLGTRPTFEDTSRVLATFLYFGLLGVGYLCVEMPLLQRFILFLGHPAYAMATVLFAILLFSGLGSMLSGRVPLWIVLILLPALAGLYTLLLPMLFEGTLGLPLWGRLIVTVVALAPPGLLMGMPFPKGMARLEREAPSLIAWAWGVNGALSVVASILSALLALSFGFSVVLALGAACYVGALITVAGIRPLRCF